MNVIFLTTVVFCVSHLLALVYFIAVLVISLGVPLLFIYAYNFKNDVRGPWDIPKINDYSHLD